LPAPPGIPASTVKPVKVIGGEAVVELAPLLEAPLVLFALELPVEPGLEWLLPLVPLDALMPVDELALLPPVEVDRLLTELLWLPPLVLAPEATVLPPPGCWQSAPTQAQPEGQSTLVVQLICVPLRLRSQAESKATAKTRPRVRLTMSAPRP
jgi:hypothetical protein